jgi:CRP/FNR family cyclic AMP-dependent transcriptional regulator
MPEKRQLRPFNAERFLNSAGVSRRIVTYQPDEVIFAQGDRCVSVLFIQRGTVKISVLSKSGKEAVVAMLGAGDFFGEGCLAGQLLRNRSAVAIKPSAVVPVEKRAMARLLQHEHGLADRFISHVLTRHVRMEEDLVDQFFGAGEMRLARTLLQMAPNGEADAPAWIIPPISAARLAELAGTTTARATVCLESFSRQGFIEYRDDGGLTIHRSLLAVVLRD